MAAAKNKNSTELLRLILKAVVNNNISLKLDITNVKSDKILYSDIN